MPVRKWTEEQKKAQAEKIREYKPWLMSTGAHTEEGKKKSSQNALKTGEYTADKVKERKRKAANKRPLFEGGTVLETYGDKRFKWNRSSKYKGAFGFGWSKYDDIRAKLRACVWCPLLWRNRIIFLLAIIKNVHRHRQAVFYWKNNSLKLSIITFT